jgi:acetylglutamate kinase
MHLLTKGYIPVIAPVSLYCFEKDPAQRSLLNINGEHVAGALAANLKAKQMVFLTDVDGIKGENGNLLVDISVAEARKLIENGTAIGGMVPKLKACLEAVSNCITTCSIVNGNIKHILLREITAGHSGTTIQPESVI